MNRSAGCPPAVRRASGAATPCSRGHHVQHRPALRGQPQALINANPQITNPSEIFPCDVLCVPCREECREPKHCPKGFPDRDTVQPGDTMFSIARRFRVSLQALIDANPHITDPTEIFPCDVLCVPRHHRGEEVSAHEGEELVPLKRLMQSNK